MRIQVRVINGATPEIRAIQSALTSLARTAATANAQVAASTAAANTASRGLAASTMASTVAQNRFAQAIRMTPLEKYGKNLQWTGRQIEYNFTLPLLLAGGAATKWALETEAATVRINKVYGSLQDMTAAIMQQEPGISPMEAEAKAAAIFKRETEALTGALTALSNAYGVNRAEVQAIAGDWAAAGASGAALARQTQMTMDTMILGELDAATATEALIAIQAQYGLQAGDLAVMNDKLAKGLAITSAEMNTLTGTIAYLNVIENETGAKFSDLTIAFSKAAGMARTAGIDVRHLGGMIAALRPAAGTASQVGNGLKSMFASILSPTRDAKDLFEEIGVELNSPEWKNATVSQRIEQLAGSFVKLDSAQQGVIATTVANKWQVSRFSVLMRDVASGVGYYEKSLRATADANRVMTKYNQELTAVLQSNPQKVKILTTTMKNLMADAIIPIIPAIVGLLDRLRRLMEGFSNLSPAVQQLILGSLALLAVFGTLTRITGAFILLFTRFGALVGWVATAFSFVARNGRAAAVGTAAQAAAAAAGAPANAAAAASTSRFAAALTWLGGAATAAAGFVAAAMAGMVRVIMGPPRAIMGIMSLLQALWITAPMWTAAGLAKMSAIHAAFATRWARVNTALLAASVRFHTAMNAVAGAALTALSRIWWAAGGMVLKAQTAMFMAPGRLVTWFTMTLTGHVTFLATLQRMYAAATLNILKVWHWFLLKMTVLQWKHLGPMLINWRLFWTTKLAVAMTAAGGILKTMALMMLGGLKWIMKGSSWVRIWTLMWGAMVAVTRAGLMGVLRVLLLGIGALATPWTLVFVALAAVVYMFRDQIAKAVNNIIDKWYQMPGGIMGAMRGVVQVIANGVKAAVEWLSWLNPFQRHSPSLVDNVIAGVDVIARKYASLRNIGANFRQAVADLKAFGAATQAMTQQSDNAKYAKDRGVVEAEMGPGAANAMDSLRSSTRMLMVDLDRVAGEIARQQGVVNQWATSLANAETKLAAANKTLDELRKNADDLSTQLSAAREKLDMYANAPLVGMRAMNQAIWENQHAQNVLNLELLKMKKAGKSVDDTRKKMSLLAGDLEMLRSERNDLRLAGAGSDILAGIDNQINQTMAAYKQAGNGLDEMTKKQKQLESLELEGQILDLQKDVDFGPALRQIEQMLDTSKEFTLAEVLAGIGAAQREVAILEEAFRKAQDALKVQEDVVMRLTIERDDIQGQYDEEKAALDELQDAYDAIENQIRDMERAMSDFVGIAEGVRSAREAAESAAKSPAIDSGAAASVGPALENFRDAAGGNFDDPGGSGLIGRDKMFEETKELEDFQKQMEDQLKGMGFGNFDIFGPIKEQFYKFVAWVDSWTGGFASNLIQGLMDNTSRALAGAGIGAAIGAFFGPLGAVIGALLGGVIGAFVSKEMLADLGDGISRLFGIIGAVAGPVVSAVGGAMGWLWDKISALGELLGRLFGPQVREIFTQIGQFFGELGEVISTKLVEPIRAMGPQFSEAWGHIQAAASWALEHLKYVAIAIGIAFAPLLAAIVLAWSVAFSVLKNVMVPVFDFIIEFITAALQVLSGIIKTVLAVINGDWAAAWEGLKQIAGGVWDAIFAVFRAAGGIVWGIVKGIVEGIVDFFKWLADVIVGHSIVPDMIDAIVAVFMTLTTLPRWVWDNVLKPIINFFVGLFTAVTGSMDDIGRGVRAGWEALLDVAQWVWDNVLWPIVKFYANLYNDVVDLMGDIGVAFWDGWKALLSVGQWVWNNVLWPIVKFYANLYNDVVGFMGDIGVAFWKGWGALTSVARWVWENVLGPVVGKFGEVPGLIKGGLNGLISLVYGVFNAVGSGIAKGINVGLAAIDKLIDGLNWIGSNVPGLSFKIGGVGRVQWTDAVPPQFAKGGVLPSSEVGGGFKTDGARAIVGEGGRHPEFVIPTDPRHRGRALGLMGQLSDAIGGPQEWAGSAWGVVKGAASKVTDAAKYVRRGAVMAAMAVPLKAFDTLMATMSDKPEPIKRGIMKKKNDIYNWMQGIDQALPTTPPPGTVGNEPIGGAGWSAIENWLRDNGGNPLRHITSTFRKGDDGWHGRGRAVDYSVNGHGSQGYGHGALRKIFNSLLPIAGNLKELILAGAPFNVKNGKQVPGYAWGQPGEPGNHWNHVHAAMAAGGIVNVPTRAVIGERGPEAVVPLAVFWQHLDNGFASIVDAMHTIDYQTVLRSYGIETRNNERWVDLTAAVTRTSSNTGDVLKAGFQQLPAATLLAFTPYLDEKSTTLLGALDVGFTTSTESLGAVFTEASGGITAALGGIQSTLGSIETGISGIGSGIAGLQSQIDGLKDAIANIPGPGAGPGYPGPGYPGPGGPPRPNTGAMPWNPYNPGAGSLTPGSRPPSGSTMPTRPGPIGNTGTGSYNPGAGSMVGGGNRGYLAALGYRIPNLADGGIVRARPGGTIVRVAERGHDEMISPLGRDSGRTVYVNVSNVTLPGITSGEDADALIRNLESLAD